MDAKRELFFELYRKYYEPLYIFVYFIMDCKEDAQDIVQDTFYKSYRNFLKIKQKEKTFVWLKTIAVKMAIKYKHKRKLLYINKYIDLRISMLDKYFEIDTFD